MQRNEVGRQVVLNGLYLKRPYAFNRFRMLLRVFLCSLVALHDASFAFLVDSVCRQNSPSPRLGSPLHLSEELDPRRPVKRDKSVGGYDPSEKIGVESINVGDPQIKVKEKDMSVTSILKELAAIQQQGPRKYCILGTRHCSYLHQQI